MLHRLYEKRRYLKMTTGWNNRITFKEHNEEMLEFRKSHAGIDLINGTRLDKAASLIRLQMLQAYRMQAETGGAVFYPDITDWNYLAPAWRVPSYKLSMN
jgi:hypothetical protein